MAAEFSLEALKEAAPKAKKNGPEFRESMDEALSYKDIAVGMADVTLSMIPVVGMGKDIYEVITGKNLVTGEALSGWDITWGVVGIVSLGTSHWLQGGVKAITKVVGKAAKKGIAVVSNTGMLEKGFEVGRKVIDSAAKLLGKTASPQDIKSYTGVLKKYKLEPPSWADNIAFNPSLKKHMSEVVEFTQKNGVTGGHNLESFNKIVTEKNIQIVSKVEHSSVKGLYNIEYKIPAFDGRGNQIGFKDPMPKTVYDPNVISDTEMLTLSQIAANPGFKAAAESGSRAIYDATAGGINFRIFIENGVITNVHPKF